MIYGTVNGQCLRLTSTVTAADTYMMLTAKFSFTSEWEKLIKIAYFRQNGGETYPFLLEKDCIPARAGLNLTEGDWEVSIRGYNLKNAAEINESTAPKITTNIAMLHVWETVSPGDNEFPMIPQTLAEQILSTAADAKETAEDVRRRADAGEFNGKDGKDGTNGKDGYTPIKGIDYADGKDGVPGAPGPQGERGPEGAQGPAGKDGSDGAPGVNGKDGRDGTSVTITDISESTESGGTSTVTFSDGKTLSVKNGIDGQGGSGSDVNADTVRGWGFAYQSEIPDTEQLTKDKDATDSALADVLINSGYAVAHGRSIERGSFSYTDGRKLSSASSVYTKRVRTLAAFAYTAGQTYICAKGYKLQMLYYGAAAEQGGTQQTNTFTGEYTGWSRVITFPPLEYVAFVIKADDDREITVADVTDKIYKYVPPTIPEPVTDQHIVDVINAAYPAAEGVGF